MQTESENRKTIPIALATDARYIAPTMVAVRSLAIHSDPGITYQVFILSEKQLSYVARKSIRAAVNGFENVKIRFVVAGERTKDLQLSVGGPVKGVTKTTYLRFLLPSLLPEISKIIYMDVDAVALCDVAELFDLDLGACCVGGVRDIAGYQDRESRCAELGIPDLTHYVNAGVLLLDLETFRKENLSDKMLLAAQQKCYAYNDQDIINVVCYGKILCIPHRYNVIVDYLNAPETISSELKIHYLRETEKPAILHYAGRRKPWYFPESKWSVSWWNLTGEWNFAAKVPFYFYRKRLTK